MTDTVVDLTKKLNICNHCKYYEVEYIKGVKIAERCKRLGIHRGLNKSQHCQYFKKSLKSRLRLVRER